MTLRPVHSFVCGQWVPPGAGARRIDNAVTGRPFAQAGGGAIDPAAALHHARKVGGPALRAMTFHDRARMLKALAQHLNAQKDSLYQLSFATGATAKDHLFDIDGGIGTLFVYASKGRREMPDDHILSDGGLEVLGRQGHFAGQHVYVPMQGAALHINAFNFPVWGMLEKIACNLLAGMPAIVKPATVTSYVTEACVRLMLEAGVLPEGALQLVTGDLGDMLDHLTPQDVVTFTGSAATAQVLRAHPLLARGAVRFSAEQDSLNACVLGPDIDPAAGEFDLFIKEVAREMTVKAGQKCTAVRRVIVPEAMAGMVADALSARLARVVVGDPQADGVTMGALVSKAQKSDVLKKAAMIGAEARLVAGGMAGFQPTGPEGGAFVAPHLYLCDDPDGARMVHEVEAFGPVSTVLPYRDLAHATALANRGQGSLVASVFTRDGTVARHMVAESGPWHGRLYFMNADAAAEGTGHGAPMPHMTHGGPGRAGGGEELGGIRGVTHYMQRVAVQGSPDILSAVTGRWVPGSPQTRGPVHPFTRRFGDLTLGETLETPLRPVTLDDIEHFANFTGDTFYAHMDEAAAQRNPFFPGRVAHGYLLLSFAAGLFVEPGEGPVLANTGLDNLRFMKPVVPGDSIAVTLTVMAKHPRTTDYGEVRWHVQLRNQDQETVAEYELLTMVGR